MTIWQIVEQTMNRLTYKHIYRRKLPHIQPPGAVLFVTFRLTGSLPGHILEGLRLKSEKRLAEVKPGIDDSDKDAEQKRFFADLDRYLDNTHDGPHWLKEPEIADMIIKSLHYRHGKVYELDTFCIMSNHVHVLFTPLEKVDGSYHSLSAIMHSLKRYTAGEGNKILNREGAFWQHESYDHYVRDEAELNRIRRYILQNPVQAGLVSDWGGVGVVF